jgi:hypothetical protein
MHAVDQHPQPTPVGSRECRTLHFNKDCRVLWIHDEGARAPVSAQRDAATGSINADACRDAGLIRVRRRQAKGEQRQRVRFGAAEPQQCAPCTPARPHTLKFFRRIDAANVPEVESVADIQG